MDTQFIKERIAATKAEIVAHENAAAEALGNGVQSYTLDTGQSRQVVTRYSVSEVSNTINRLYNRLATLEARLNGGTVIARPHW